MHNNNKFAFFRKEEQNKLFKIYYFAKILYKDAKNPKKLIYRRKKYEENSKNWY